MRATEDRPDDLRPHFELSALVTVDVQRDVLDGGTLEVPGTSAALGHIADLACAFRSAGRPIVHVVRLYLADGSNADEKGKKSRPISPGDFEAALATSPRPPPANSRRAIMIRNFVAGGAGRLRHV